jgi:hypothetical protein
MRRAFFSPAGLASVLMFFAVSGWASQVPEAQRRIPQQIVINGLTVNAASVMTSSGQVQSFTCSSPQHYTTLDGSSQGWACYDELSGVWLMNAVPPVQAPAASVPAQSPRPVYQPVPVQQAPVYGTPVPNVVYQQPAVVYQQAPPVVIYQQPAIVYAQPFAPVVVAPYPYPYPPSVLLGAAAIGAAGRIVSAAIIGSGYPRAYYYRPIRGRR